MAKFITLNLIQNTDEGGTVRGRVNFDKVESYLQDSDSADYTNVFTSSGGGFRVKETPEQIDGLLKA